MKNHPGKRGGGARKKEHGTKFVLSAVVKSLNITFQAARLHITKQHALMPAVRPLSEDERLREMRRTGYNNRRAIVAGEPARLTLSQWLVTLDVFNWNCAYCGGPYDVLEHFYPIGYGRGTTVINCVPACKLCNRRKANHHPFLAPFTARQLAPILHYFWNAPAAPGGDLPLVVVGAWGDQKLVELTERAQKV